MREKIGWLREAAEAAGRDSAAIELQSLVFVTAVADDPAPIRAAVSKQTGMSVEEVAANAGFLTGSGTEICDRLMKRREETGISYVVIQGGDPATIERFAEAVVAPLGGR
jgi:alkanesulfonate monooxygenase SsuD/methylene tetrahydromethanopterin reductase-like flavin-dependent oxidoreductase (luciferase family)